MTIALLAAALASICHAQSQPPATEAQARYYVYGAFLTHAVPEIMGERVALGAELQQRLGLAPDADRKAVYDALMNYTEQRPLIVRKATTDDLASYKRDLKQPVFRVQAGDVTLLVEYDLQANTIPFVGQLNVALQAPRAAAPPVVEPSRPAPPVATIAPPPARVAPPPAPTARPQEVRQPNGPCLVKPVMSEQDLANCRSAPVARVQPGPPVVAKPQPRVETPQPRRRAPCEIKPVMTEEDLANCRAVGEARTIDPGPPPAAKPRAVAKSEASPALQRSGPCEVKPVMSEEDLANCRSAPATRVLQPGPPVVVKPRARVEPEPQPRRGPCVVKPVMSEEDLANCRAASGVTTRVDPGPPAAPRAPVAAQQPAPKPATRPCLIKPVMSEEDLIACGMRR